MRGRSRGPEGSPKEFQNLSGFKGRELSARSGPGALRLVGDSGLSGGLVGGRPCRDTYPSISSSWTNRALSFVDIPASWIAMILLLNSPLPSSSGSGVLLLVSATHAGVPFPIPAEVGVLGPDCSSCRSRGLGIGPAGAEPDMAGGLRALRRAVPLALTANRFWRLSSGVMLRGAVLLLLPSALPPWSRSPSAIALSMAGVDSEADRVRGFRRAAGSWSSVAKPDEKRRACRKTGLMMKLDTSDIAQRNGRVGR